MPNAFKRYKTNKTLENTGVELDFGDFVVVVRRAGGSNRAFNAAMASETKSVKSQLRAGTLDERTSDRILRRVLAKTVVLDWWGVAEDGTKTPFLWGDDDRPLECTPENVETAFSEAPDFMRDVFEQASSLGNFLEDLTDQTAGK